MIEVSLDVKRWACDAISDPFPIEDIETMDGDSDVSAGNRFAFNLIDPNSNLEPD